MRRQTLRSLLIPVVALLGLAAWPDAAHAQRRARAVPRRVVVRQVRPVYVSPWYGVGYPYRSWYYAQWGYPYPPYGYVRYDDLTASVRLEVTPNAAEVYVDGYRAGTVDDFDGVFQRLHLRPGEHEIVVYLDGYRTLRQTVYLNSRADQKIRSTLVPLGAGEQPEPRPEPAEPPDRRTMDLPARRGGPDRAAPPRRGPAPSHEFGAVSIRVQPPDAQVSIDGEPWSAPQGQDRLVVELPAGSHQVEIRKDGFDVYSADVNVPPGDTVPLNVSLRREE